MKNNKVVKRTSLFIVTALALVISCSEEERITSTDAQAVTEESISDAYFEDVDGMSAEFIANSSGNALGGRLPSSGRVEEDDRISCAEISFSPNSTSTAGVITVDFGDGCTIRGNKRSGKIILTYSNGPRGSIGFKVVTTFDNYKINDVQLQGTRTVTRIAASNDANIKHSIVLENGRAIWPENGGEVTRTSEFTREWVRDVNDERVILDGVADGTNRRGKDYAMEITSELVFRRACILSDEIYMAVEGTKVFTVDGKIITVDYGDGTCDRSIRLNVNGVTRDVTVGGK
jgi:hypothetical protein